MTYFTTYDLLIILRYRYVFFVKQKTAYAMRISDWSSDVCSSDLVDVGGHGAPPVFWCSRSSAFILAISRRRRTCARRRRSKFSSEIGLPSITSPAAIHATQVSNRIASKPVRGAPSTARGRRASACIERQSVVEGKRVAARMDLGGRRVNKK